MIVQDQGDQLILIRQTDHAALAGFFAREWGNNMFSRPEPHGSFLLAATDHDNGWTEWEQKPRIDPATFLPYTYTSIPTADHIELYLRGIDRLVKTDHYAGLLVSMHGAALYDRALATLPGYSAKYVKSDENQIVNEFVQRLRLQQLRLKVDLRANPSTKEFVEEKALQRNSRRFESLDRLALYFCQSPLDDATIDAVPVDNEGNEVDWELHPQGATVFLAPYPFRRDPLEFSILARKVPKRRYADSLDFQKVLARSPYFAIEFILRARHAIAQVHVIGA